MSASGGKIIACCSVMQTKGLLINTCASIFIALQAGLSTVRGKENMTLIQSPVAPGYCHSISCMTYSLLRKSVNCTAQCSTTTMFFKGRLSVTVPSTAFFSECVPHSCLESAVTQSPPHRQPASPVAMALVKRLLPCLNFHSCLVNPGDGDRERA